MGANFYQFLLEEFANIFKNSTQLYEAEKLNKEEIEVVMSILSNYVPAALSKQKFLVMSRMLNSLE